MLRYYIDHDDDGGAFGHLGGEIDVDAVAALAAAIEETARRSTGDVVLDLEAVTFIDSSGVRAFLEARERLDGEGRRLVFRRPSTQVGRVIEILGLQSAFVVEDG